VGAQVRWWVGRTRAWAGKSTAGAIPGTCFRFGRKHATRRRCEAAAVFAWGGVAVALPPTCRLGKAARARRTPKVRRDRSGGIGICGGNGVAGGPRAAVPEDCSNAKPEAWPTRKMRRFPAIVRAEVSLAPYGSWSKVRRFHLATCAPWFGSESAAGGARGPRPLSASPSEGQEECTPNRCGYAVFKEQGPLQEGRRNMKHMSLHI
jgi:hypothetical protein